MNSIVYLVGAIVIIVAWVVTGIGRLCPVPPEAAALFRTRPCATARGRNTGPALA